MMVRAGEKEVVAHIMGAKEVTFKGQPSNVHFLALEQLAFPLLIRPWREGDRMQPLGMEGHRKLSDIFIDGRLDRFAKESALVFEAPHGIVLLDGFRISETVRINPETKQVLRIEIRMAEETA